MCLHAWLGSKHDFGPFNKLYDDQTLAWLWLNHQGPIFMTLNASKSSKGQLLWSETIKIQANSTMESKSDIKHPKIKSKHAMIKFEA